MVLIQYFLLLHLPEAAVAVAMLLGKELVQQAGQAVAVLVIVHQQGVQELPIKVLLAAMVYLTAQLLLAVAVAVQVQ
jgi:hypothetical protein